MKRVSFKVAKTIKDVGYPQDIQEVYKEDGEYFVSYIKYSNTFAAPTYLEVWLWLWKEKGIAIDIQLLSYPCIGWAFSIECISTSHLKLKIYDSQEDAVIAAIDYLVDNDLIKVKHEY